MGKKWYHVSDTRKLISKSQEEKEVYTYRINDLDFLVFPNVFSPKYFEDSVFFANKLPVKPGEDILEIGSGTGIISVSAGLKGADVMAVDINPDAVANTQANIDKFGLANKVKVVQGDVFNPLSENAKFDTIFWNLPFGYVDEEINDDLEKAFFDPLYKSTQEFFTGARKFLKPNGRLLYGYSSSYGNNEVLNQILEKSGYSSVIIDRIETEAEGKPVYYELFEAVANRD